MISLSSLRHLKIHLFAMRTYPPVLRKLTTQVVLLVFLLALCYVFTDFVLAFDLALAQEFSHVAIYSALGVALSFACLALSAQGSSTVLAFVARRSENTVAVGAFQGWRVWWCLDTIESQEVSA